MIISIAGNEINIFYISIIISIILTLVPNLFGKIFIGNSSSGIIEVPSFNIPTINIGNRQDGRVMPSSVINCLNKKEDICKAINSTYDFKIHYNDDFYNPYYKKGTAENIVKVLESSSLESILFKRFHDL